MRILIKTSESYPILLIDESQDTKKELVDAFFEVQKTHSDCFCLGMFGDTMQRIYTDGKIDLGQDIPDSWAKPAKTINYRCPKRVITLINKIRSEVDGQSQEVAKTDVDGVLATLTTTPWLKRSMAFIKRKLFTAKGHGEVLIRLNSQLCRGLNGSTIGGYCNP